MFENRLLLARHVVVDPKVVNNATSRLFLSLCWSLEVIPSVVVFCDDNAIPAPRTSREFTLAEPYLTGYRTSIPWKRWATNTGLIRRIKCRYCVIHSTEYKCRYVPF